MERSQTPQRIADKVSQWLKRDTYWGGGKLTGTADAERNTSLQSRGRTREPDPVSHQHSSPNVGMVSLKKDRVAERATTLV